MSQIQKDIVVANKKGMHARPAALLVQIIGKYDVAVTVIKGDDRVNGKSIMGLLMLGAQCGNTLTVLAEGNEALRTMEEIEAFFAKQEEEYFK